jgi:alpha-ketoglutarate-dependent 2,4-dichlorophenoxyacetate dioxygenase
MIIRGIQPSFCAEVTGIDLREPMSPAAVAEIEAAMDRYAVLAFPGQSIDDAQQLVFSRNFGPLEPAVNNVSSEKERRIDRNIADVSNLNEKNELLAHDDRRRMFNLGNRLWHSDSSFKATPSKYSLLSGRVVPSKGGDTQFADMRAAWDDLDEDLKQQVVDLVALHSLIYSRATLGFTEWTETERQNFAPVRQRLVRRHPVTQRRSLFLASHIGTIEGMPMPEARALVRDLIEHATQPAYVYSHAWHAGDLVIWDNRVTMHRGLRYDALHEIRDMRRTTIMDVASTLEQAA